MKFDATSLPERGLICAGFGDYDPGPIVDLAEHLKWPLVAEISSNARRPGAVSTYEALLRNRGFAKAHRPEFVIRFGSLGTSKTLLAWLDAGIDQVTVSTTKFVPDPARAARLHVMQNPAAFARSLMESEPARENSDWYESWMSAERLCRKSIDDYLDATPEITEPRLARDTGVFAPPSANIALASSMPVRDADWFMAPRADVNIVSNRGVNGIDGFVSTVAGFALASENPTVALVGDLALLHDQNGLDMARAAGVKASFVVINNDGGGIFSFLPHSDAAYFEELFATPHGLDLSALAKAHGCSHILLEKPHDLEAALSKAGGLWIIEARTDRKRNVEYHRELFESAASAV